MGNQQAHSGAASEANVNGAAALLESEDRIPLIEFCRPEMEAKWVAARQAGEFDVSPGDDRPARDRAFQDEMRRG